MTRATVIVAGWLMLIAGISLPAADVGFITINGAIGPATVGYISRAIDQAADRQFQCLIIELDTPGGLLDSTKVIVQKFLAAEVPIVVYVSPAGAVAGSAGCFITLAADVAVMSPTTSIGAAHPVALGGNPMGGEQKIDDAMKQKLENYSITFIETIAARRNRNVEWARSSVRDSAAISAEKALAANVIDFIAKDMPDLLRQLDGRAVNNRTLQTAGAKVIPIPMATREKIFQLLWRPEVMFILMLMAMYGIIGELSNPGAILPGVVGAIALILALYMSAILPVNVAGLALMGLAVILFIADIYAPTHGVLTVGGIAAFFIGALMLFDSAEPMFRLSLRFIIPGTLLTAAFFVFVVGAGLRAQWLPVKVGREALIGRTASAVSHVDTEGGRVIIEGEYWNATSPVPVEAGRPVEVVGVAGLTLAVKPKPAEPPPSAT